VVVNEGRKERKIGEFLYTMYSDNDDDDDGGFKDGGFFFLAPAAASAAATTALTAVVCGKSGRGEEVVAEGERRTKRIKGVGCERNWVGNGLRRVYVMSLYLWLALECVLLGTAAGYRPLKDGALAFDNSLWLNEVWMMPLYFVWTCR
jgi:hypothetical protein